MKTTTLVVWNAHNVQNMHVQTYTIRQNFTSFVNFTKNSWQLHTLMCSSVPGQTQEQP